MEGAQTGPPTPGALEADMFGDDRDDVNALAYRDDVVVKNAHRPLLRPERLDGRGAFPTGDSPAHAGM